MAVRGEVRTAVMAGAERSGLHPGAWLAWLVAASALVLLTSNPLYLSLAFLSALGVYVTAQGSTKGRTLRPFVLLGVALAIVTVPFNVLTGSFGATELASLPELRFPRWFGNVTVGGAITSEALVTATGRAIAIATLVLLAGSFNATVNHFRLLRLAPRAMSQLVLSLTIAIVVVPQAMARGRAVAEAKRLRGRPARGLSSVPGLLLPVLHGALEQAVQRAESMDARGLAGGRPASSGPAVLIAVAGVGLLAWGAFWHYYDGAGPLAAATMAAGGLTVGAMLLQGGFGSRHRLRRDGWTAADLAVVAASTIALLIVAVMRLAGAGDVAYVPYPEVVAPGFHLAIAAAFLLTLAPALFGPAREADA